MCRIDHQVLALSTYLLFTNIYWMNEINEFVDDEYTLYI